MPSGEEKQKEKPKYDSLHDLLAQSYQADSQPPDQAPEIETASLSGWDPSFRPSIFTPPLSRRSSNAIQQRPRSATVAEKEPSSGCCSCWPFRRRS